MMSMALRATTVVAPTESAHLLGRSRVPQPRQRPRVQGFALAAPACGTVEQPRRIDGMDLAGIVPKSHSDTINVRFL